MDLEQVKRESARLSPWAHVATVGADGDPDVVPVHPAWEGDTLWFMTGATSVKARNIAHQPNVAMHWQVTEAGDGIEVWGSATVHTDVETKKRLWTGVFDYDLDLFAARRGRGIPRDRLRRRATRTGAVPHRLRHGRPRDLVGLTAHPHIWAARGFDSRKDQQPRSGRW